MPAAQQTRQELLPGAQVQALLPVSVPVPVPVPVPVTVPVPAMQQASMVQRALGLVPEQVHETG